MYSKKFFTGFNYCQLLNPIQLQKFFHPIL